MPARLGGVGDDGPVRLGHPATTTETNASAGASVQPNASRGRVRRLGRVFVAAMPQLTGTPYRFIDAQGNAIGDPDPPAERPGAPAVGVGVTWPAR